MIRNPQNSIGNYLGPLYYRTAFQAMFGRLDVVLGPTRPGQLGVLAVDPLLPKLGLREFRA